MSDIIIITIVDEDYVESWFFDSLSLKEKASQTFVVRSKTDKSPFTNKMYFLDVYAKRHQLDNAVRVKQERKARTQFRKRDKIKRNRHKIPQSASRLRKFINGYEVYRSKPCLMQDLLRQPCAFPTRQCKDCSHCPF